MGLLDALLGGGQQQGGSPLQGLIASALGGQQGGQGGGEMAALGGLASMLLGGQQQQPGASPLQGLIGAFEQQGLGHIAQSWVGDGANHPVSPDQLHQVLGPDQVQSMASQTGMDPQQLLAELAQMLPGVISQLSNRGGQVPGGPATA